ncbi:MULTISPECIES: hypothetical protein [Kordiimonas]|jgi:hypothetical protein|uniref:hypothetical protein n=1 Tax=Kordiimonas TaxID=288021 RepID=UPI00258000B5|nr:hypothetical protein [Kordiimonas sp. UBA4487]
MTQPVPTLNAKQAAATLQFLSRTQMQGAEMPAYVDIFNVLSAIVSAEGAPAQDAEQAPADAAEA